MRRLIPIALTVVILSACSGHDAPSDKIIEKAAEKALQDRLGDSVKARMTADGLVVSGKGAEYSISFSIKKQSATGERPQGDLPLFPGASITGYFKGAGEDTVRLKASGSAEEIAEYYFKTFKKKGFTQKRFLIGEGDFSGAWISSGASFVVYVYSYKEEDQSQIVMIISWAGKAPLALK